MAYAKKRTTKRGTARKGGSAPKKPSKTNAQVYDEVFGEIVAEMQRGTVPWVTPYGTVQQSPRNAVTGRRYTGGNVLLLWAVAMRRGFTSPAWITMNQARKLIGKDPVTGRDKLVLKQHPDGGWPRPTMVISYFKRRFPRVDAQGQPVLDAAGKPLFNEYMKAVAHGVFNLDQLNDHPEVVALRARHAAPTVAAHERNAEADSIAARHGMVIAPATQPGYSVVQDMIGMPSFTAFRTADDYYTTLFHEQAHWTGHPGRLNRGLVGKFGDPDYAYEELVAELAAAFLSARFGFTFLSQSAAYLSAWQARLGDGNGGQYLMSAASLAAKAANLLYPEVQPDAPADTDDGEEGDEDDAPALPAGDFLTDTAEVDDAVLAEMDA